MPAQRIFAPGGRPGDGMEAGEVAGSLWGTDVYTGDSALAVAAVHAGLVNVGETAVARVAVEQPRSNH